MNLCYEKRVFTTTDGREVEYFVFYVVVHGIKVYLKVQDKTGAELLKQLVENGGK